MIRKLLLLWVISIGYSSGVWAQAPIISPSSSQDFYQLGLYYGSPEENKPLLAIQNLQIAAQSGHLKAMYALGWMYYFGKGVDKDYAQAKHFFQQAADQQLPEAQHMLSVLYSEGKGVKMDRNIAFQWTVKAANNGNKSAQAVLHKLGSPANPVLK